VDRIAAFFSTHARIRKGSARLGPIRGRQALRRGLRVTIKGDRPFH
jgi:hypothetical protein